MPAQPAVAQHGDGLRAPAELGVGVVDLQQVLEDGRLAVLVLQPGEDQLLLGGQALQGPHRGLQHGLRRFLGLLLGRRDGLRVVVLQIGVVLPDPVDLLSQRHSRLALADDEGDHNEQEHDKTPHHWVLCVFRHKTLFRRQTAGC